MSVVVKDLSKQYRLQMAVDRLSFQASAGRILGFLGPNGAGKSTTMKIITGYLQADSGSIEICGLDITQHSREAKALLGYLPEHTPLYSDMYVKEFLSFVAETYKLDNTSLRVKQTIEQVGLGPEQHKKILMLSKGYRQRVGLAQAIIHDPKVLILDEPTSGLDPNQLSDIRKLIRNLGQDKTVILSTHIMQEVESLCDDLIIINKGKVVADSDLSDIKAQNPGVSLDDIFKNLTAVAAIG